MTSIALRNPYEQAPFLAGSRNYGVVRQALEALDFQESVSSASLSIDGSLKEASDRLQELAREYGTVGWDGYDAHPVTGQALSQALTFLRLLPTTVPVPHISAHPDGELAFTWTFGSRRILTLAVSGTGRLSFALLHGHRSLHGSDYLVGELPESIALALRDVLGNAAEPIFAPTGA